MTRLAATAATVLSVGLMVMLASTILANPGKTESLASAVSRGFGSDRPAQDAGNPGARLGEVDDDAAGERLDLAELNKNLEQIKSPDPNTRWGAAGDLLNRKVGSRRPEVLQAARSLLAEPEGESRKRALRLLGRWGAPEDLPAIAAMTRDPDQTVRDESLHALAKLKNPDGLAPIVERFRTPEDRSMAVGAFKEYGKGAAPTVVGLLDDPDRAVQLDAARVLEQIADRSTLPALEKALAKYKPRDQEPASPAVFPDPEGAFVRDMTGTLSNAVRNAGMR